MDFVSFKKADAVLIALLLCLSLLPLFGGSGGRGAFVVVSVAGRQTGRYALSQDRTVRIETENGVNILQIEGGKARIIQADCPGGDCMAFAPISRSGQLIVCMPHQVAIRVEGGGNTDALSY